MSRTKDDSLSTSGIWTGFRSGQLHRRGNDRGQHRFKVERGVDCLADLAEGTKLPDRLGKFAGAGLYLLEQAHVLDGDHRLIRESCDKLDLLVDKWPNGAAEKREGTERPAFA